MTSDERRVEKTLNYVNGVLAPGGHVIVGDFQPEDPAKEFMDHGFGTSNDPHVQGIAIELLHRALC